MIIIWIDGTFAVGKTAVANSIVRGLSSAYLLEFDALQGKYKPQTNAEMIKALFGPTYPEAKEFLIEALKIEIQLLMQDGTYDYVIIPIALINDLCRKNLVEFYSDIESHHFILTATDDIIQHRAARQDNREMDLVLTHMQTAKLYLNSHYPDATRIHTSSLDIDQVAAKIIENII